MFRFENYDIANEDLIKDKTVLEELQFERRLRIQNCTHSYLIF
jgi:hypothetical protein